jgi:hypothetical protein
MTPWDHHPAFTDERLKAVARLIQAGRNLALDRYDVSVGCSTWTLGCEAFELQRHQIIVAAEAYDWLEIIDPSMRFVFGIGGMPVRFYRGEADDPTERTLKQSFPELYQLSLFSAEELSALENRLYRFAVETDVDGSIAQVSFLVLDGAQPLLVWPIELDGSFGKVSPLWPDDAQGVDLPAPTVGIPTAPDARKGANDDS